MRSSTSLRRSLLFCRVSRLEVDTEVEDGEYVAACGGWRLRWLLAGWQKVGLVYHVAVSSPTSVEMCMDCCLWSVLVFVTFHLEFGIQDESMDNAFQGPDGYKFLLSSSLLNPGQGTCSSIRWSGININHSLLQHIRFLLHSLLHHSKHTLAHLQTSSTS